MTHTVHQTQYRKLELKLIFEFTERFVEDNQQMKWREIFSVTFFF